MTVLGEVLNLQVQNPHFNFAKGAKLKWGILAGGGGRKLKVPPLCSLALRFGRDDRFWEVGGGRGLGCQ